MYVLFELRHNMTQCAVNELLHNMFWCIFSVLCTVYLSFF